MKSRSLIKAFRDRLLQIIKEKSYEKKDVTLASGKKSDFYIDCRQTTLHPEGAYLVGKILYEMIKDSGFKVEAIGGPTMGADPIATAVSVVSQIEGNPLPAFIVRKEPKKHGLGQWIEGKKNLAKGAKVAIVEDVVTTGGSSVQAVKRAEEEGLKVVAVFAVVDREEGGSEKIKQAGYEFKAIFTKKDIVGG
ncbi:MAG: orotate phosphoribosyltransferase [Deltaproteobacteria bacterium RIFCSPLOWO2_12_FULL_43_16]|nr:MAG: orotate phosphoribosyltransferase [Deltaproteobacteria bacterium GWA2_43_19]OGQ11418.1 MAG: orotate phosphoribosyltransferase [Deltaproteobacteria bacterium RIFCSPHIGHO2_02_FULL_43_33]OGQ40673.1 MAG: orotate phosphoribosyltransferase [Deltaproteobacteria bacterium RIFCSPLOWO2_01_FULL_42_9]OGQ60430.1 MAG: orotate phosphoribosyltransferase [Deltaproteobacteria bacterium RIFCSPLOWO2_12_FULL_43_16]HBR17677.1 orotate phosphoribosyltransferase [Deltaproteobacteria bacterium]